MKDFPNIVVKKFDWENYIYKCVLGARYVMDIIDDRGLAKVLKAKIKDRPDLGKDERYGRRVLFEFNKAYPIVMSPMLSKYELEELFMEYLGYYYDLSRLECEVV